MSRYGELMYLEDEPARPPSRPPSATSPPAPRLRHRAALHPRPLDPFSPQFQSMTLEKGAMVFHMLRWEMGDEAFQKFLAAAQRNTPTSPSAAAISRPSPRRRATAAHALLRPVDRWHRRARIHDKYSVYRLGNNKGFRTVGAITRTSTSSACRSSCASRPTAKPKTAASTSPAPTRLRRRHLRPPAPHRHRSRELGAQEHARPRRSASPSCAASNSSPRATSPARSPSTRRPSTPTAKLARQLPHRRSLLHAAQLPVRANSFRDALRGDDEPALDRGLEPHPSAASSTSPASATAPSTSTASPSRPTTTPRAPSTKPAGKRQDCAGESNTGSSHNEPELDRIFCVHLVRVSSHKHLPILLVQH
jgi:hypothetical protein